MSRTKNFQKSKEIYVDNNSELSLRDDTMSLSLNDCSVLGDDDVSVTSISSRVLRNVIDDRIKGGKFTGAMGNYSESRIQIERHPLFMSELALEIYSILALFLLTRNYLILHGITLVIVAHIVDVLFSWFLHIREAREIRLFKSWLLWWVRIGLDFASTSMEMDVMHLVVANTLTFWNWIGKRRTMNFLNNFDSNRRAKAYDRAKEQVEQLKLHHNNVTAGLRDTLMRNPGQMEAS